MTDTVKILVAGDVKGKFKEVFDRVRTVNKKSGPFHLLLCVGDFFPPTFDESLTVPEAPIPALVLGPTKVTQLSYFSNLTGCDLGANVTYLGQRGVYRDTSGLKIAYFSGTEAQSVNKSECEFNYEDIKNFEIRLQNEVGFSGVDILITSQWPVGIENTATTPPPQMPKNPSALISRLAATLKPRYHFVGLEGIHYERAPYRNHEVLAESTQHVTRFIALAEVANPQKAKWLYAFNITPMHQMTKQDLIKQPEDVTDFPYKNVVHVKPSKGAQGGGGGGEQRKTASANQFFYDTSYTGESRPRYQKRGGHGQHGQGGDFKKRRDHDGGGQHQQREPPGPCWFCLASPEVEKHLIISIGDSAYLTLAKGGLTNDHVLILPIGHFQNLLECPQEVVDEVQKFKAALEKYFASQGKAVIFFERNFKSPHLQIQAVPVPASIADSLKFACLDYAEAEGIEMQDFPSNAHISQMTRPGFPYFYMELPDESKLFVAIRKNFPIQFGRELLASPSILRCEEKIDWKACKMSKEEETRLTKDFREAFKSFDPTIE